MANDPLQHVAKGTPLLEAVTADVLNALKEEARKSRASGMPGPSGGWSSNRVNPSLTALVRNDTGADLSAGYVVALSDKIGDPVNEPITFQQRPAFAGDIPAASTDLIGILAEPIRDGEIGRAVVLGVAVCDVLINDAGHGYAKPIAADETRLASAPSGPARIEWKESSGTTRRAIVWVLNDAPLTIKEVDGSPSVSAATLELPNSAMSNPSAGVARLLEASASTGGTVTLSAQTMGDGDKTFQESVVVNSKKQTGEVIRVWGTGTTDPVILSADSHVYIGGATNTADLTVSDDLAVLGDAAVTGNATVTGTSNLYDDVTINPLGASGQILTVNGTAGPVLYTSNTGTHADGGSTSTGVTFSFTSHGDMLVDEGWLCQSSPIQAFIKAELAGTLGVDKKMTAIFSTYPLGSTRNQFSININGYESDGTPLPAVVMDFNLDSATVTQRNVMLGDGSGTSPVWGHHGNLGVSGSLLYGGTVSGGLVTNVGSAITPGSISGFDEAAQDAVGTILVDTATVNLTYTDGTPSITADVITGTSGTVIPLLDGNNTYSGTATFTAAFAAGDKVSFTGNITPTTLIANTNNWAPTNW